MARRTRLSTAAAVATLLLWSLGALAQDGWTTLAPGLELGEFADGIHVLRIDVGAWELVLLSASAEGEGRLRTARGWCEDHGAVAAVNASMYQTDYLSSVSLMRMAGHVNNPRLSKDNTVLVCDPVDPAEPPVRIVDRTCEDLDAALRAYRTQVQGIRMLSCHGNNVWDQQPRRHSTAAVGLDGAGRLLFLFGARALSTHDFIERLRALPLDLVRCMYVEGGPPAQLYVGVGGARHEFVGAVAAGLRMGEASPVPNVLAIRARTGR